MENTKKEDSKSSVETLENTCVSEISDRIQEVVDACGSKIATVKVRACEERVSTSIEEKITSLENLIKKLQEELNQVSDNVNRVMSCCSNNAKAVNPIPSNKELDRPQKEVVQGIPCMIVPRREDSHEKPNNRIAVPCIQIQENAEGSGAQIGETQVTTHDVKSESDTSITVTEVECKASKTSTTTQMCEPKRCEQKKCTRPCSQVVAALSPSEHSCPKKEEEEIFDNNDNIQRDIKDLKCQLAKKVACLDDVDIGCEYADSLQYLKNKK